jgi:hypothetical protein
MKRIIWLEMALIGASILVFRSVWTLLDSLPWAKSTAGLLGLLLVGIVASVLALRGIAALPEKKADDTKSE